MSLYDGRRHLLGRQLLCTGLILIGTTAAHASPDSPKVRELQRKTTLVAYVLTYINTLLSVLVKLEVRNDTENE